MLIMNKVYIKIQVHHQVLQEITKPALLESALLFLHIYFVFILLY